MSSLWSLVVAHVCILVNLLLKLAVAAVIIPNKLLGFRWDGDVAIIIHDCFALADHLCKNGAGGFVVFGSVLQFLTSPHKFLHLAELSSRFLFLQLRLFLLVLDLLGSPSPLGPHLEEVGADALGC